MKNDLSLDTQSIENRTRESRLSENGDARHSFLFNSCILLSERSFEHETQRTEKVFKERKDGQQLRQEVFLRLTRWERNVCPLYWASFRWAKVSTVVDGSPLHFHMVPTFSDRTFLSLSIERVTEMEVERK